MSALKEYCSYVPQRWIVVLMCFLGLFNAYGMRICLSIAITEMVVPSNITVQFLDDTCPETNDLQYKNETTVKSGTYQWDEYTQGIVLSSFYWGYIFTNLPGGLIAEKFGGKHTLSLGILFPAILTLLMPFSIEWGGSTALICLRILMGLGEGTTYPALSVLLAQWIPEDERAKAGSIAFSGAPLGTIFGTLVPGVLLKYSSKGWPVVFYFFGAIGILQFLLNTAFCYNKPSEHPFITAAETQYLKKKLKNAQGDLPPTPWKHVLTSTPVWALVIVTVGNAWGFLTLVSDMPKFMSSVLKFAVDDNGYLSSLPYFCMWVSGTIVSCLADWIISKGHLSIGKVRKIGSTIASVGPATFLVAASYAGCNGFLVVALLTTALTLMGCASSSILINALDLGPNYAGTIMGLVNGIATVGGIISPYAVGIITPNQTISEWRLVFWIVCAFFVVSNIIFLIYGSGELQEWNDPAFLMRKKRKSNGELKDVDQPMLPMKEVYYRSVDCSTNKNSCGSVRL